MLFWTCKSFALAVLSMDAFQGATNSEEQGLHVPLLMNLPIFQCPARDLIVLTNGERRFTYQTHGYYLPQGPLRSIPIPRWLHLKLCRPTLPRCFTDVPPVAWRPLLGALLALRQPPLSQAEVNQALDALHRCIRAGFDDLGDGFDIQADLVPLWEFLDHTRCANSRRGSCMGKVFGLSTSGYAPQFEYNGHPCNLNNVSCPLSADVLPAYGFGPATGDVCEASCMVDPNMGDICTKAASITSMQDNCLYLKITREDSGEVLLFLLVSIPWTLGEPRAVVYQAVFAVGMAGDFWNDYSDDF